MANKMRWRYGDTNPVMLPVDSTTVIEIGDLVYLDTDDAKPASSLTDAGTLAANQEALHDVFVGVAMQASATGQTADIRVATTGVFELECASATFELGDLVGGDENAGGTALEDQQAIAVTSEDLAIGRCAKREGAASTSVYVEIVGTVTRGGPQAAA
ncbi:capsid cement protein [Aeoliella sp.]|uniref:capsid cement protein n=1 Tax=Aeoliella sp. TaxID=2795800 RepID=UPI003CCBE3F2